MRAGSTPPATSARNQSTSSEVLGFFSMSRRLRALVAGGVAPERIQSEIPFAGVLLKKDKDLRTLQKNLR